MGQSEELTSEINECDESLELDAVRQRAAVHKPAATCRHNGMQSHGECLSGRGDKGACECDIESAAEDLGLATDYSDSDLQSVGLLQERILDEQGIGILNKSVSRLARKQRHQHLPGRLHTWLPQCLLNTFACQCLFQCLHSSTTQSSVGDLASDAGFSVRAGLACALPAIVIAVTMQHIICPVNQIVYQNTVSSYC